MASMRSTRSLSPPGVYMTNCLAEEVVARAAAAAYIVVFIFASFVRLSAAIARFGGCEKSGPRRKSLLLLIRNERGECELVFKGVTVDLVSKEGVKLAQVRSMAKAERNVDESQPATRSI